MKREQLIDCDLPDDLAALATQLSDDAELLARWYTCGFEPGRLPRLEASVCESAADERRRGGSRRSWSWTRAAAILLVAAGTTMGALWQLRVRQGNVAGGVPATTSVGMSELASAASAATSQPVSGTSDNNIIVSPTFVSADAAEGLSGEEIEVLADAFGGQVAEI